MKPTRTIPRASIWIPAPGRRGRGHATHRLAYPGKADGVYLISLPNCADRVGDTAGPAGSRWKNGVKNIQRRCGGVRD